MSRFHVVEHTVKCQHTRERWGTTLPGADGALRLAVKQYIPIDNVDPAPGDVTIIGAHATGFPKELYEPFWDDLYTKLSASGVRVRGIWIADIANHGQSAVLNEHILGNDMSWLDHGRDLLFLINQFQEQMPQPLIGIGHSKGGAQIAHLALLHPGLLQALILIEPVILTWNPGMAFARSSAFRRDQWPSREEAAQGFRSSPFYKKWDPRVLEKWIEYGLRDMPTEKASERPKSGSIPAVLTTPKEQEVFTYLRPAYRDDKWPEEESTPQTEIKAAYHDGLPFYRPEASYIVDHLPELRPSVLYIFGEKSPISTPKDRKLKMDNTGTGPGGSGGAEKERVHEIIIKGAHLLPFDRLADLIQPSAEFIQKELLRWKTRMDRNQKKWARFSLRELTALDERWISNLGGPPGKSKKAPKPKI